MAQVKVKAKQNGYYDNKRIKEGVVFYMEDKLVKVDNGIVVSPKWVELASESRRKKSVIDDAAKEDSDEVI